MGHIINVDGPHFSLDYDGHIWKASLEGLGLWNGIDESNEEHSKRFEVYIGDGHYSTAPHCASPIPKPKPKNQTLHPLETEYNNFLGSTRSTIEQVFGYLKTWAIISGVYRGMLQKDTGFKFLNTAVHFCCELYNARFTIVGGNKRHIRVYARDDDGVPLCPPPNLTPENLRIRFNLHKQLSMFNQISNDVFYLEADINSKCTSSSFRTGDHVWVFVESMQDCIKANITGCVNNLFSIRSANKKLCATGVKPSNIFPRVKNSREKPILSQYTNPASLVLPVSFQSVHIDDFKQSPSECPTGDDWPSEADASDNDLVLLDDEILYEMGIEDIDDEGDINQDEEETGDSEQMNTGAMEVCTEVEEDLAEQLSQENENPWRCFSTIDPKTIISTSHNREIELTKKNVATLLDRRWLNDQILNYFATGINQFLKNSASVDTGGDNYTSTGNGISTHIFNTWLCVKLGSFNVYGEIGHYDYKSVRRHTKLGGITVWNLDTMCIPVHIRKSHWLCCII
jgi:hypothetical protein